MKPIARIVHITSLMVAVLLCGCATRFTDGSFESEAVVDDIYDNAATMRFTNAAKSLSGRKVFLATGEYEKVVPNEPLDEFWAALPEDVDRHERKIYRCGHSMMGCRRELAAALADFILKKL